MDESPPLPPPLPPTSASRMSEEEEEENFLHFNANDDWTDFNEFTKEVLSSSSESVDQEENDAILEEYLESSSSSSSEEEEKEREITMDERRRLYSRAVEIGEEVLSKYSKTPQISPEPRYEERGYINKLYHLYYFSIQHIILFHKYDGNIPKPDIIKDNEDTIREKSYHLHIHRCYVDFIAIVNELALNVFNTFKQRVSEYLGPDNQDHPILDILNCIPKYKEMHSRRLKMDPSTTRTKSDEVRPTYNSITLEPYDKEIKEHRLLCHVFFVPLPSDFDYKQKDPKEGDHIDPRKDEGVYLNNVKVDILNGNYKIPEPFGYVVCSMWERKIRMFHTLLHFEDYFYTYITEGIIDSQWKVIEKLSCEETWDYLMDKPLPEPRHKNETPYCLWIAKLNKEKKTDPVLIYRIAVLRDVLEAAIKFR